jgi:hypothetical protein
MIFGCRLWRLSKGAADPPQALEQMQDKRIDNIHYRRLPVNRVAGKRHIRRHPHRRLRAFYERVLGRRTGAQRRRRAGRSRSRTRCLPGQRGSSRLYCLRAHAHGRQAWQPNRPPCVAVLPGNRPNGMMLAISMRHDTPLCSPCLMRSRGLSRATHDTPPLAAASRSSRTTSRRWLRPEPAGSSQTILSTQTAGLAPVV